MLSRLFSFFSLVKWRASFNKIVFCVYYHMKLTIFFQVIKIYRKRIDGRFTRLNSNSSNLIYVTIIFIVIFPVNISVNISSKNFKCFYLETRIFS